MKWLILFFTGVKERETSVLTNADKQLLERWTSMAAKNPATKASQEFVQTEEIVFGVPIKTGRQPLQEISFPVPSADNSGIVQHGLPLIAGQSQQHACHVTPNNITSCQLTKPSQVMDNTQQNHFSQMNNEHNVNDSASLNYSTIDLEGLKLCGLMNLSGNLFQTNSLPINPNPNLSAGGLMPNDNQLRRNSDEHSSPHSSGSCPASPEQNILPIPDNTYTYGSSPLQKRTSGELSPPCLPDLSTSPCGESGIGLENQFQITPPPNYVGLPEVSLSETRTVTRAGLTDSGYSLGSHVDQNIPRIQLPFSFNQPSTSQRSDLPQQASPPDNISLLTKQLSRSQVEDGGPPALVHTPRGTCSGYGVGMDFDQLMFDAQESDRLVICSHFEYNHYISLPCP